MGLFGKMFQKKSCVNCGCELGLTGWRSLADGFLCKDCTRLLSPFFTERKESTSLEILGQLEYRKENLQYLNAFQADEIYGDGNHIICVDRANSTFLVSRNRDWRMDNPDVVDISSVRDVVLSVREGREEVRVRDGNGNMVSYDPPCYRYHYDFDITILVEHPYFDRMTLSLADNVPGSDTELYNYWARVGTGIQVALGAVPTQPMAPRMDDPLPMYRPAPVRPAPVRPAPIHPVAPRPEPSRGPVGPANRGPVGPANRGPVGPANRGPAAPASHSPAAPANRGPVGPANRGPVGPANRGPMNGRGPGGPGGRGPAGRG